MARIGVHVSILGSIDKAVDRASERNCDTFQLFTRNPRQWKSKGLSEEKVSDFTEKIRRTKIGPVVAHMPYLPNIASPRRAIHRKSVDALTSELKRCGRLKIPYLVTHSGSHMGTGFEEGLRNALNAIDTSLSEASNEVILLLENTAGARNSMCSTFEEIQTMIERMGKFGEKVGVCLDTCHAFAAGYDLRGEKAVETSIDLFRDLIGLRRLRVIHANDSKGGFNSRTDRHEHIGLGKIGEEGFRAILHHRDLRDLPFIMETPVNEARDDYQNIKKLRELAK
ncbi:MAG: deoxyribonuclease IV [Promethearchaeati archaeon SRVP18_Atabeyarchaeia-1]